MLDFSDDVYENQWKTFDRFPAMISAVLFAHLKREVRFYKPDS